MTSVRGRQRGVTMVEFALAAPVLLLLMFGSIDFSRIVQARTTVAEAARQAARQAAANADAAPDPWVASAGTCSGTTFSNTATGGGCLTDARMIETATAVMSQGGLAASLTPHPNTAAAACNALTKPSPGQGLICIAPAESGSLVAASCPASPSLPDVTTEGNRFSEWSSHQMRGCFLVQVTVIWTYQPFTGLLQGVIGNRFSLVSSTSTIAEY